MPPKRHSKINIIDTGINVGPGRGNEFGARIVSVSVVSTDYAKNFVADIAITHRERLNCMSSLAKKSVRPDGL